MLVEAADGKGAAAGGGRVGKHIWTRNEVLKTTDEVAVWINDQRLAGFVCLLWLKEG